MSDFVSQFNFVWNTSELQQALAKLYSCQENWLSQLWISVSHINPHEGIFPCSSRFGIKHGQHFYHEKSSDVHNIRRLLPMTTSHRYVMTSSHDIRLSYYVNNCFITIQTHVYGWKKTYHGTLKEHKTGL